MTLFALKKNFVVLRFLTLILSVIFTSCVTYIYPVGKWDENWAEPIDLSLHESSLAGVAVQVNCQDQSNRDTSNQDACLSIRKMIKGMSAVLLDVEGKIIGNSNEEIKDERVQGTLKPLTAEIVINYREVESTFGTCGWSLIPMFMTGSFIPCLAEASAKANFSVTSVKTGRTQSWPLEVKMRRYNGIGALFYMLTDGSRKLSRAEYQSQLNRNLITFVRNKVYTAAVLQGGGS